jgi:cytochrome c oxidase subunit 4
MQTGSHSAGGQAQASATAEAAHAHPQPRYYFIWFLLFILTVVEVLVAFFSGMPKVVLIVLLMILALWKALLVALYYMHLKFEPRKLWYLAMSPLPLILILLGVVLSESW